MDTLQRFLETHIGPLATKLNKSDLIGALTDGMMGTMPITLGVSVLSVLLYLPIEAWQAFLTSTGLLAAGMQALQVTTSMLCPYIIVSVSRAYAMRKGYNEISCIVLALATFFILIPLNVVEGEYQNTYTIGMDFVGANGIFIAMILGLLVPTIYGKLIDRVGIKLPPTVPSMVTDSLAPTFVAMILFTATFIVKWALSLTGWGNLFTFFNSVIAAPIMNLGASPIALIVVYTFACLLWFFGIHPAAILNVYAPALTVAMMTDIQEFLSGTATADLPYLHFEAVYNLITVGGTGMLIGLGLSMLTAKSDRYKSLRAIGFIPDIFNISEPLMFGTPVVLNPIFLILILLAAPINGAALLLMSHLGLAASLNPAIQLPWVMPAPILALLKGGVGYLVMSLVVIAISFVLYYPFFRTADNMALKEEAEIKAAESGEVSE